jgi:hypothetical protein
MGGTASAGLGGYKTVARMILVAMDSTRTLTRNNAGIRLFVLLCESRESNDVYPNSKYTNSMQCWDSSNVIWTSCNERTLHSVRFRPCHQSCNSLCEFIKRYCSTVHICIFPYIYYVIVVGVQCSSYRSIERESTVPIYSTTGRQYRLVGQSFLLLSCHSDKHIQ